MLSSLGYVVHTPAELFGSRDAALGVADEVWLSKVGRHGWIVIASDIHIFERPNEYQAYLKARLAVFLLPGESRVAERLQLIGLNLAAMCGEASQLRSGVWRLTADGPEAYVPPAANTGRRRRARSMDRSGGAG
jgi:hypothetical protein